MVGHDADGRVESKVTELASRNLDQPKRVDLVLAKKAVLGITRLKRWVGCSMTRAGLRRFTQSGERQYDFSVGCAGAL